MAPICRLVVLLALILCACQPVQPASSTITVLDGEHAIQVSPGSRIPADLFIQAGLLVGPDDEALFNGRRVPLNQPLREADPAILQLRRAISLTVNGPEGTRLLQTTAQTVGEALAEAGYTLYSNDRIDPPPDSPRTAPLTVTYIPSRQLSLQSAEGTTSFRSAAETVGQALAEAGISLAGLDYTIPEDSSPLPEGGEIRVVHVTESLVLAQKPIAFENEFIASSEVPLDQQSVLNPGQTGLTVSRVRIRYEDGQEVSRQTESETLVRPPQNRVVGYGTKVEVKTASVDGVNIEYWRAVQMFATAYSPCRSAPDRCYSSTASGKPVKKGVVALRTDLYAGMRGQALYIPGYGRATVEDACGGCVGKPWIDLGYSDSDYQQWGTWVTVYFLTPVPVNVIYVLD